MQEKIKREKLSLENKSIALRVCAFIILSMLIFGCVSSGSGSQSTDEQVISRAKRLGFIHSIDGNIIRVDRSLWHQMSYEQKGGLTLTCFDYIKKNTDYSSVVIECMQTHKTLAIYDDAWGLRLKN